MDAATRVNASNPRHGSRERPSNRFIVSGIYVLREGRAEPFLDRQPTLSSSPVQWGGIALESYAVPALFIPRHEHTNAFLQPGAGWKCQVRGQYEEPTPTLYFPSRHNLSSATGNRGRDKLGWANAPHRCRH